MKINRKKIIIAFFILCILLSIYVYICAIDSIPENTVLFKGENLNIKTIMGISLQTEKEEYKSILTSSNPIDTENTNMIGTTNVDVKLFNKFKVKEVSVSVIERTKVIPIGQISGLKLYTSGVLVVGMAEIKGTTNVDVKLFNKFKVKEVSVSVIERTKVIPIGQISGLKLYTSGVLVVGMAEIKGTDNEKYKPYENTGIKEGDMIVEVGEKTISDTDELLETVNSSKGKKLKITYVRDGETLECNIKPIQTSKNEYKLGLWVRDSAAGIGTMTFYEPSTKNFAALGHGISDVDTGDLVNISNGEFITTRILSIIKGEKGNPGKIQGSIDGQTNIGRIYKNTNLGIYGVVENTSAIKLDKSNEMEVATRNEIKLGQATILASLDNKEVKEYSVEIEKIFINNDYDNKSMLIKVTDEELLNKTGGIIQGMSGCPIIQNGKFIGAITNVLVNDPMQGYGVFGDMMIKEMKSLK